MFGWWRHLIYLFGSVYLNTILFYFLSHDAHFFKAIKFRTLWNFQIQVQILVGEDFQGITEIVNFFFIFEFFKFLKKLYF